MERDIELELRSEVSPSALPRIFNKLKRRYRLVSRTNRLSVMFFGRVHKTEIDIRVRVTNGISEVVLKKGSFHAHDRIEIAQNIQKEEFLGLVRILAQLNFEIKVGEREIYNFAFGNNITISVVKAGEITYLEVEKMSNHSCLKNDRRMLLGAIRILNLKPITSRKAYETLCDRLTALTDWRFNGSPRHYARLKRIFDAHFNTNIKRVNTSR